MDNILIVDDDPDIRRQLGIKLSKEGYGVFFAVDAYDAVQSARKIKPDLIILDLMLPAGGGLHALKNIRLMPEAAMIPIVVLTGTKDEEIKRKIKQEGVEAFMLKPYDYTVLSETIKKLLAT